MSKYKFNNVPAGCVVIKLETFFRLQSDSNFLDALKASGVDNWCDINDDTKRVIFNTILLTSALSTLDELVGEDDLKNELGEIILGWFQKNMKAEVEDGT